MASYAEKKAKLSQINDAITEILPKVAKRDVDAAKKVIVYSQDLCDIYYEFITKDINFTFSMNLEQHLWKQAFHKIIDALKTASNSNATGAKTVLGIMVEHIVNGICFYEKLLTKYQEDFEINLSTQIVWPSGLPSDDFCSVLPSPLPTQNLTSKQKFAVKSCSRHVLALGDLHRYKCVVQGSEDYSLARSWYLKSSLLWPSSGHSYNQLAVVAFYSMLYRSTRRARHIPIQILSNQRQTRVLDEIFFCVRALAATHSFEAAKDRLFVRLAAMRKKVSKYEGVLDSEAGHVQGESELAASRDRPREIWVAVNGIHEVPDQASNIFEVYLEQQPAQLLRRTVSYIIDTAGLLITKIGMEHFTSVSERAISQLAALVLIPNSPITSNQLIQMSLILIYAVHVSAIKSEPGTCSVQQQLAVQTVISLFGALLQPVHAELGNLSIYLKGEEPIPKVISRVLPSIGIVSEWLSCPHASNIYRTMPSVDPLPIQTVKLNTWEKLADIANKLVQLEDANLLGKLETEENSKQCVLPELVFVSSFLSIFSPVPKTSEINLPGEAGERAPLELHLRLRNLLVASEYIDGSCLSSFYFDESAAEFRSNNWNRDEDTETELSKSRGNSKTSDTSDEVDRTRDELLEFEKNKQKAVIVVRPLNLILDTNAFVHHLALVQKLVECGRFQIIIPTIVIEELLGLSQNKGIESSSMHGTFVREEAKRAIAWLKEKAKEKCPKMNTLTTQGKKLVICIVSEEIGDYGLGKVNDDRILQSCTSFVENFSVQSFTDVALPSLDSPPIYRNVVLLSEDRGICIKATSQNIPSRTVPSFVKWAKIE